MVLHWEVPPEEWILSWVKLSVVFALTDPSWEEGPIYPGSVFGGNMAIRTRVFEAGYRFDSRLGPRGHWYAMCSETELTKRLSKAGFNSWHCKKAVVEHMVRKSQMTRRWIFRRALKFGRGMYRTDYQHEYARRKKYWGVPRRLIKRAVKEGLGAAQAKLCGDRAKFFERRWELNHTLGQMIEAWLIHRELQSDSARHGSSRSDKFVNSVTNTWKAPKGLGG